MPSDIEMGDADQQSENGSVTTSESSQADEYDVEEILAEKGQKKKKVYLVKWLGYPVYRSSWEPRSSFHNDAPLNDWEAKLAKIKAKQLPPFDVKAFEKDVKRRENETQARRQARRRRREAHQIENQLALKSTLFSDDEDSGPNQSDQNQMPEPPLSWGEVDKEAALFVSTDSSYSDDSSDDSFDDTSGDDSEALASTTLAHSHSPPGGSKHLRSTTELPVGSEKPTESAPRPALNVSRTTPGLNQVASKTAQNPQHTTSTPKSGTAGNPAEHQTSSRKVSTSIKAPPNRAINAPARPPVVLAGFGDMSAAPARDPSHHTNTKWYSRESRWGSDRAPNASDLQLFKPSDATSLRNPPVNASSVPTQALSEQSSDLGIIAPQSSNLTNAPSHETNETTQCQPATNTVEAISSPQMNSARINPRATGPNIGSPALHEGEDHQGSSTKDPRRSIQAPARRPALDPYRPSATQSAENRSPVDSHEPAENRNRPLAPPLSPTQRTAAAPVSPHRNSVPPRASSIGGRFKDTRIQSQGHHTNYAVRGGQSSANELISRMPVGNPGEDAVLLSKGHFWNRKEVYAHIFFGPEKHFVGQVRICGMPWEFRNKLLRMKSGPRGTLNMWFKEICNVEQYTGLCDLCPGVI
ncbi:hypothetical protein VI817_002324 [Penicillium citrinum]|nr:hypothetical protein VI817_002324 [Penicillium citrinum]